MPSLRRRVGWLLLVAAVVTGAAMARAQQPDSARHDSIPLLPAVLIGHVSDSSGAGVPGAEITLVHSDRVRIVTGDSGEFRITGLSAGTNVFNVRRIGFQSASFTAVLKPGKTHRATFTLSGTAQPLPAVAVSDTSSSHWLDQYKRRQTTSRGTFIDRKEIERKSARTGTDIVRTVPGIRLVTLRGGAGNQVVMTRGAGARPCLPSMYVHGMPYSGMLDDFSADDIEALEIYVGVSEIPPEFDKVGKGICGVIVVWTRDPSKKP